jgi:hypothetical protein
MATAASLRARQDAIVAQYNEQEELVRDVQHRAISELLPALKDELDLDDEGIRAGRALLQDRRTSSLYLLVPHVTHLRRNMSSLRFPFLPASAFLPLRRSQTSPHLPYLATYLPLRPLARHSASTIPVNSSSFLPPLARRPFRTTLCGIEPQAGAEDRGWKLGRAEEPREADVGDGEEVVDGS